MAFLYTFFAIEKSIAPEAERTATITTKSAEQHLAAPHMILVTIQLKHSHVVAASCGSPAFALRQKLVPSAAAPLPRKSAALGFAWGPFSVGTCTVPRLRIFFLPDGKAALSIGASRANLNYAA
ncbi:MAG: hypothetical protein Q3985_06520 [Eubacteriales bacterium]|nr:hypothetical protein [Eubacteriales bacterium]